MAASLTLPVAASIVPGGVVTIGWTGIDVPTAKDWIGLYPRGAAPVYTNRFTFVYTNGGGTGVVLMQIPSSVVPGPYELGLNYNNSDLRLATLPIDVVAPAAASAPGAPSEPSAPAPAPATGSGLNLQALLKNPLVIGAVGLIVAGQVGLIGGRRR